MYSELSKAFGDSVRLFPHLDRCDIAIGNEVGIDVKDYRDPARLARKLNRSLGGLRLYPRKIVAVASRRASDKEYVPRLREQLSLALRQTLVVDSVDSIIRELKKEAHRV